MQNTQSGILGLELAYPEAQLFKLGTDFSMFGEKQQQMMQRGVWYRMWSRVKGPTRGSWERGIQS